MLRFFGKIRINLLEENKVARYLAYTVEKIFLVVVGILIAPQVNNWNEERKNGKAELLILREIHANLQVDLVGFGRNIVHLNNQQVACVF